MALTITDKDGKGHDKDNDWTIAVFVIAHPDDESMFFLPTICALKEQQQ